MARSKAEQDFQDELSYHRREWIVQRLGWTLMAVGVFAALLGVFGSGPLAQARVGDAHRTLISYERFIRRSTGTAIDIASQRTATGELRVQIDNAYLSAFRVLAITPEPLRMESAGTRTVLVFAATGSGADITLFLEPQHAGARTGVFEIAGEPPLVVKQFVYP